MSIRSLERGPLMRRFQNWKVRQAGSVTGCPVDARAGRASERENRAIIAHDKDWKGDHRLAVQVHLLTLHRSRSALMEACYGDHRLHGAVSKLESHIALQRIKCSWRPDKLRGGSLSLSRKIPRGRMEESRTVRGFRLRFLQSRIVDTGWRKCRGSRVIREVDRGKKNFLGAARRRPDTVVKRTLQRNDCSQAARQPFSMERVRRIKDCKGGLMILLRGHIYSSLKQPATVSRWLV
ncbi:hypothetical protein JOM56_014445 [Amanita muscaria]